jgi:RNA polymerase sigma-70 factor (ECF subfamily)
MAPDAAAPSEETAFVAFAERLRSGEDQAARELLSRYSTQLISVARRRLGPRLAVKVDPDDVLQSVFRTFFRRLGGGEVELRDWTSRAGLLSLLTLRKCQLKARHYAAARRDARLETSFGIGEIGFAMSIPDRAPTPDEVAAFSELVERLLGDLSDRDGEIVRLLLAGESVESAAARLRRSRRTVQRTLVRIRRRLLQDIDPEYGLGHTTVADIGV